MFLRVKLVGVMGIVRGVNELCFLNVTSGLVLLKRGENVESYLIGSDQATIVGQIKMYAPEEVSLLLGGEAIVADESKEISKPKRGKV